VFENKIKEKTQGKKRNLKKEKETKKRENEALSALMKTFISLFAFFLLFFLCDKKKKRNNTGLRALSKTRVEEDTSSFIHCFEKGNNTDMRALRVTGLLSISMSDDVT